MASFNGEKYIGAQIVSIIQQLSKGDELIISDDGSSDRTVDIIKSFEDDRITLFENLNFRNHIKNFNFCLSKAKGDYIFLADQDDVWKHNKVAVMLEALKKFDVVVSDCVVTDADLLVLFPSFFRLLNSGPGFLKNFIKNTYLGCCIALSKKILIKALPFPTDIISHDNWIGLMGEIYGRTCFLDKKLLYYRRHGDNVSFTTEKSRFSFATKAKQRIVLAKNIIFRYFHLI